MQLFELGIVGLVNMFVLYPTPAEVTVPTVYDCGH